MLMHICKFTKFCDTGVPVLRLTAVIWWSNEFK